MKKTLMLIGSLLLTLGSFDQSAVADNIIADTSEMNSDGKQRKDKGYYNTMQASLLFRNIFLRAMK